MHQWSVELRSLALTQRLRYIWYCSLQRTLPVLLAVDVKKNTADTDLLICFTQSTSAILMENRDMYMLNPCSNKIWYVEHTHIQFSFTNTTRVKFLFISSLTQWLLFSISVRFIIELCEPIQVKQLDIANFELFSSTPKEFIMSISDRYALRLLSLYS